MQVDDIVNGAGANDTDAINDVLGELDELTKVDEDNEAQTAGNIKATTDALGSIADTRATVDGADITSEEVQVPWFTWRKKYGEK